MEPTHQEQPATVAATPKQAGDWRQRMTLQSGAIWTERMLETLERGIKGGKWYSLIDKVWNPSHLRSAAWQVISNEGSPGIDHRSTERLERELDAEVEMLSRQLREQTYRPKPVQRVWIEKLGSREKRPLGIPTVRDRVVQGTVRNVIEPIFEQGFAEQSYGFRPGRGTQQAVERVEQLLAGGRHWVVDADLKSYFDTIPHDQLMEAVGNKIADGRLLDLIKYFLKQGVMEAMKGWTPTERGTPQGAVVSPLLANIYLNPLDHLMAGRGWEMIRYADDFIILCQSQEQAQQALAEVQEWVQRAGLILHPEKTRIVDASQRGGFDFLGWHFERGYKWPREKSVTKLKESLREKTPRKSGLSMECIITSINRTLRGWMAYFGKGNGGTINYQIDRWLRMRLRSILRKRNGRKGRGRGYDHNRYQNAYFAELELISLVALARAQRSNPAQKACNMAGG